MVKVKADIELFKTSEGGRKTPFINGYRPLFDFSGARTLTSGKIDVIERDGLSPGETGKVIITFIKGIIDDSHFKVGERFSFGEGVNLTGQGTIIEIIENDFRSVLNPEGRT